MGQRLRRAQGDVAVQRREQRLPGEHRFVGQRAAGKEATHITAGREWGKERRFPWRDDCHRLARGVLQATRHDDAAVDAVQRGGIAQKVNDDGLVRGLRRRHQAGDDFRVRGFGDKHNHVRLRVAAQQVEGLQRRAAANACREIPPAHANRLGNARAERVESAGDGLQAGSGSANEANTPAPHAIGETEADAVDNGRATVRPHEEASGGAGLLFQGGLFFQGDVVAVEEDVFAHVQRFAGDAGGVAARHGDQYPFRVGQKASGGGETARAEGLPGLGAALLDEGVQLGEGGGGGVFVNRFDDNEEVIGGGALGGGGEEVAAGKEFSIGGGGHDNAGIQHPRQSRQPPLQLHQHN